MTTLQAMSIRVQDLLDARNAPHSPAMVRTLAAAVREWRLVVRELLAQSATDPAHLDAADLRARLDRKLQEIERLTEQALNENPDFHAHLDKTKKDFDRANNLVAKGDIAKRTFDQAKAAFDIARADLAKAQAQATQATSARLQAQAELARTQAQLGAPGEDNAQLREAKAALETAKLNLEFTEVRASVDGYVTNVKLRFGSQAVANQPSLALVDTSSFYARGFFRENAVGRIRPGMPAVVTLMTYPDRPVTGRVASIGWGIYQADGASGPDLLPKVNPTFEWIRLAQRVPVRIHLDSIPDGVDLRVGTTASVLVMTGDAAPRETPPVPAALR